MMNLQQAGGLLIAVFCLWTLLNYITVYPYGRVSWYEVVFVSALQSILAIGGIQLSLYVAMKVL